MTTTIEIGNQMEKKGILLITLILLSSPLVPGCLERSDNETNTEETDDGLIYVPLSEIINNTKINNNGSAEGWNLTLCLELVEEDLHAFKDHEYDNITGILTPQPGNNDHDVLYYTINGSLDGRQDNYRFNFEYHHENRSFTLGWESISRHAIPNEVRNRILNLALTNYTMSEFFEKFPGYHEYYEWYSDTDNRSSEQKTPKDHYPEFANSTLESNIIRASFGAPGLWIPERYPRLECIVDLSNNHSNIKYINRIP